MPYLGPERRAFPPSKLAIQSEQSCSQRDQRDFRWTVQPHRNTNRANPKIRVEHQLTELAHNSRILPSHLRKPWRSNTRKPNLASMRMPGQLQVHRSERHLVGEIRFMSEQNCGLVLRH